MKKNVLAILAFVMICFVPLCAQETDIQDVYHYVLDNGLELFIAENDLVPLTYIELAVKGGGIAQTKDEVGLFHLYEHMIFKGNSKYPDAASVQKAISDMGVPNWNGSTGNELINYFFTVPSDLTYDGLEFWSYAVREPLLNETEFENEKDVVISELQGYYANPNWQLNAAIYKNAFDTPWQFDPAGDVEHVRNATLDSLIEMKNTYYVPNNTALFVGGDVEHKEVLKMVEEIYGDWEKAADPWENKDYIIKNENLAEPIYLVQANPQVSPEMAQVQLMFRGPDGANDVESTYAADMFTNLASNPASNFVQSIVSRPELGIPSSDYVGTMFGTTKHGTFMNYIAVMLSPSQSIVPRTLFFDELIKTQIANDVITNGDFFPEEEYKNVSQRIKDTQIVQNETAQGILSGIRSSWASVNADYFFDYQENISDVSTSDVAEFYDTYVHNKNAIVLLMVNPQVYEMQKTDFDSAGFTLITPENAFWWN